MNAFEEQQVKLQAFADAIVELHERIRELEAERQLLWEFIEKMKEVLKK